MNKTIKLAMRLLLVMMLAVCFTAGICCAGYGDEASADEVLYDVNLYFDSQCGEVVIYTKNAQGTAAPGELVEIEPNPDKGYHVESVVFGTPLEKAGLVIFNQNRPVENNKFIMPAEDVYIQVRFVPDNKRPHKVYFADNIEHGKLELATDTDTFYDDEEVQIVVTPDRGYRKKKITVNWVLDGGGVSSIKQSVDYDNTFTMPNHDVIISAEFRELPSYTLTGNVWPENTGTVEGTGKYYMYERAVLTAVPDEDHAFVEWRENGAVKSYNPVFTTKVFEDEELTAHFRDLYFYTVMPQASPSAYGSVSGGGTAREDKTLTVSAEPNKGYVFYGWSQGGRIVSTDKTYSFKPTRNETIKAVFKDPEATEYPLWVGGDQVDSNYRSNDGWSFDPDTSTLSLSGAYITGELLRPNGGSSEYPTNLYARDMDLTISLAGENYIGGGEYALWMDSGELTITGEGTLETSARRYSGMVTSGSGFITITGGSHIITDDITVPSGIRIEGGSKVEVNGKNANGDPIYSYSGDIYIKDSTVIVKTGTYGICAGDGKSVYIEGDSTVECTVSSMPIFTRGTPGGIVLGEDVYIKVPENGTVQGRRIMDEAGKAVTGYALIEPLYKISNSASPDDGGTVTVSAAPEDIPKEGMFKKGSRVTARAEAAKGYRFKEWTDNDKKVSDSAEYEFDADHASNLTAVFEKIDYKITVDTANGTLTIPETAGYDDQITIEAAPEKGYVLEKLTYKPEGGTETDIISSKSFTMPDSDVTVKAVFKEKAPLAPPVIRVMKDEPDGEAPASINTTYFYDGAVYLDVEISDAQEATITLNGISNGVRLDKNGNGNATLLVDEDFDSHRETTITVTTTDDSGNILTSTVTIVQSKEKAYIIKDQESWDEFVKFVNEGNDTKGMYVRLEADATVTKPLGLPGTPFEGDFDGGGHTIKVSLKDDKGGAIAPFGQIKGAVIRNLKVTGTVEGGSYSAGLVASALGSCTIRGCDIGTDIKASGDCGGIIGESGKDEITIDSCAFTGSITGTAAKDITTGVFIGLAENKKVWIENCIEKGTYKKATPVPVVYKKETTEKDIKNCYYSSFEDQVTQDKWSDFGKQFHKITGDGTTISNGEEAAANASGITVFNNGVMYDGVLYAGSGDEIKLFLPEITQCDSYLASAGTLSGEGRGYKLAMGDQDVTISLEKGKNHVWDEGTTTIEPTYTKEGRITYTCTVCKDQITEPLPVLEVTGMPLALMKSKGRNKLVITWSKTKEAEGYDVFFAKNGKKLKRVKTVKAGKTLKLTKKKLKKKTAYKACVKAWVKEDGKKVYIKTGPSVYAFTSGGSRKYCNPRSVKVNKTKVSLKKGKSFKIKAKVTKLNNKKKLKKFAKNPRYISSDKKIAVVNSKGRITAKAKGTCKIYVIATNGVLKTIMVNVK